LDLSNNPYLSVTLSRTGATNTTPGIAIEVWDVNGLRYGLTDRKVISTTPTNVTFTFFAPVANYEGQVGTCDMSKIAVVLFNFDSYDSAYTGTVTITNLQIGDKASNQPTAPAEYVAFDPIGNRTLTEGVGLVHVLVDNIAAMQSSTVALSESVTLTATSSNTSLIPNPVISDIVNGQAWMDLIPASGQTGTATITVTGTAKGCTEETETFTVTVTAPSSGTPISIAVNAANTYQTITGFSNMINCAPIDQMVNDMGCSAFRIPMCDGSVGWSLEPVNDNQDPNILDLSKFQFPLSSIQEAQQAIALGVTTFIGSVWSAPYWTKKNLSGGVPYYSSNDDFVDSSMYAEFAEWMAGTCIDFKEKTGVYLYAVSCQNEPQFDEIYGSGNYTGPQLNDLVRTTGQKLVAMGIPTRIFFAENLQQQGAVISFDQDVVNDAVSTTVVSAFAQHDPNIDPIANVPATASQVSAGSQSADWQSVYALAQQSPKKENWMTEVAGFTSNIAGGMSAAGDLYEALMFGNINLWSSWDIMRDMPQDTKEVFGVHKNFYFVKPGAKRIDAISSSNSNVLSLGFQNTDGSYVIIAINRSASTQLVNITGSSLPNKFRLVQTSANQYAEEAGVVFSPNYTTILPASSVTTFIGNNANIAPTINQAANQLGVCNTGQVQTLTLTGISPVESTQAISSITATSSNQTIISNANISLTAVANGTSTLTYTPTTGAIGVAMISVRVLDNGGTANGGVDTTTMTFEVEVGPCTKLATTNTAKFSVFPNPTTGNVTVYLASDKGGIISVVDLQGKLVLNQTVAAGQTEVTLNLQSIDKGVYIIKVDNGVNSSTEKLIKD
jgi:O-glycosyl hydrolase